MANKHMRGCLPALATGEVQIKASSETHLIEWLKVADREYQVLARLCPQVADRDKIMKLLWEIIEQFFFLGSTAGYAVSLFPNQGWKLYPLH